MRKFVKELVVFAALIIVFSVFVYAAGSSTGGDSSDDSDRSDHLYRGGFNNNSRNETNKTDRGNDYIYQNKDCESFGTLRERVKCRLIQGEEFAPARNDTNATEEACRVLNATNKGRCAAFYASVRTCYKLDGRAKDACFKRASGLSLEKRLSEQSNEGRDERVRNYMVAVLYNLQERVERFHEMGKISDDEASALIEKIVLTKQTILSGKSKAEIRTMLQELKQMWKDSLETVEEETQ